MIAEPYAAVPWLHVVVSYAYPLSVCGGHTRFSSLLVLIFSRNRRVGVWVLPQVAALISSSCSAFCAAILLLFWAVLVPCAVTLWLEAIGVVALLRCPAWPFTFSYQRGHRHSRSPSLSLSQPVALCAAASGALSPGARGETSSIKGRLWTLGALAISLVWIAVQCK